MQDLDLGQTTNGPGAGFHIARVRATAGGLGSIQVSSARYYEAAAFKRGNGDPMPRRGHPAWDPEVPAPPHRRRRGLLRRFVRDAHHSVMAGHSRPKGRRASHAYVPAIHVYSEPPQGVDARTKSGHDD
jgi:hypothetical protein